MNTFLILNVIPAKVYVEVRYAFTGGVEPLAAAAITAS